MTEWQSEDGRVRLFCGDCRDVLPTLADGSIDAVVTDPPYGLGKRMSGGTWGRADKYGEMRVWDKEAPMDAVASVLALAKPTIMWGGNNFAVPPSRCWLSWSKANAVRTMASMELAWTNFDRPAKEWRGAVGVHDSGHPTQKPVPLMEWCLSFLPEACAVCDPFMGSGTTGIACVRTGRKFVGIEKDARYFAVARRRIEHELRQGRLDLQCANGERDGDAAKTGETQCPELTHDGMTVAQWAEDRPRRVRLWYARLADQYGTDTALAHLAAHIAEVTWERDELKRQLAGLRKRQRREGRTNK